MARRERVVPNAISADGPFLTAMLDTLDDLYDLLDERLPKPAEQERPQGDGAVRLTVPAASSPSGQSSAKGASKCEPVVLTEPAPAPEPDPDGPDGKPIPALRAAKKTTAARRRNAKES